MVLGPYATMGRRRDDAAETATFTDLADEMDAVATVLRDPARTRFHVVTHPEVLAVRETDRLLDQLRDAGIPVGTILVNRVLEQIDEGCERCSARRERQQEIIHELRAEHRDLPIVTLPDRVSDLQGPAELAPLADRLADVALRS
jgi:arsenite-transporting ATPase